MDLRDEHAHYDFVMSDPIVPTGDQLVMLNPAAHASEASSLAAHHARAAANGLQHGAWLHRRRLDVQ